MKLVALTLLAAALAGPALADVICDDRADKATGTCTVKDGHWLVTDNTLESSHDGTDTYLISGATLKYGVSQRMDVEAYMPLLEHTSGPGGSETGNGDLTLRAKYKIVYAGALEYSIEPFVRAPTGHSGLSDRGWEGGALMPIGLNIGHDLLLGTDPEVDILRNKDGSGVHLATQQVVSLSRGVMTRFLVSGELWTDQNYDPIHTSRQYSADLVIEYVIAKHFVVDTGVNFGLNAQTPHTQLFVGLAKRY